MEREQGGDRSRDVGWWNEQVQLEVREKKLAFERWQSEGTMEVHNQYREKN